MRKIQITGSMSFVWKTSKRY